MSVHRLYTRFLHHGDEHSAAVQKSNVIESNQVIKVYPGTSAHPVCTPMEIKNFRTYDISGSFYMVR